MYRDNGNGVYIFDGDLEQFLLDKGIEVECIKKMKNKILQHSKDEYYSSKYLETGIFESEIRLVPLSKVIGTSRGTVGKSVFENVRSMPNGKREPHRFHSCLSFLDNMSLEELRASYEKLYSPVDMEYYKEDDEYYLTSDGNHRTLTAMLVGAENIKARVTTMYCDFEKRERYLAVEKFYNNFNINKVSRTYRGVEIIFSEEGKIYVVNGFSKRKDENYHEYIDTLSGEIEHDMKIVKVWKRLPKIIRSVAMMFCKNQRIIQYIDKSECNNWSYRIDLSEFE